jgi:hypothetical protein
MLIRVDPKRLRLRRDQTNELRHLLLDRLRIGSSVSSLLLLALTSLPVRHPSLPSKLRVGECVEEVGLRPDRHMEVHRVVLAELERLEPVDDEGLLNGSWRTVELLEEEAVTAEPLDLAGDGGGGDPELPGDLAVGGAGESALKEGFQEVRAAEPVGGMEGL